MKDLLSIAALSIKDIEQIFQLARKLKNGYLPNFAGITSAYSFEGNSLRTRATFLKAMARLEITAIELPNLLKTNEDKTHLAGYLDQWMNLYIIRESNHEILETFAGASKRPVVNAMSSQEHPCEVLADVFFLSERLGSLQQLKVCLVGPDTNVLRSWRELCELLQIEYVQVCPEGKKAPHQKYIVHSLVEGIQGADVILTDHWPDGSFELEYQVTLDKLQLAAPQALVIPCPPFDTRQEIHPDVIASPYFAGYEQKRDLYVVHQAILVHLLGDNPTKPRGS
jgi:ornithine carbamoyltransferase